MIAKCIVVEKCVFFLRSDYFKTAEDFKTVVGDKTKIFEVKDCPYHVLETVINFMYGIDLPDTLRSTRDTECLLTMADVYLMEDLKDAVASHLTPLLNKDNILDIYHLAEMYTAKKLNEECCNYIATSIDIANIAKQILGIDATTISSMGKGKSVFKKDMIVRCVKTIWWTDPVTKVHNEVQTGTVGRIIDSADHSDKKISIKWNSGNRCKSIPSHCTLAIRHLEILTPPIDTTLFKD